MKVKRFIIEYASYKKQDIENNGLMKIQFKIEKIDRIDQVLSSCKRGYITVDEAIGTLFKI